MNPQNTAKKELQHGEKGITSITIRGFKSLAKESSLAIRPLTLLAGANSSGKSSAMQPLLLLKQTLEASYDPGPLLLNGPNVRFTSLEQIFSNLSRGNRANKFSIKIEVGRLSSVLIEFTNKSNSGIDIVKNVYNESITIKPDMSYEEIISIIPSEIKNVSKILQSEEEFLQWRVGRIRCFLTFMQGLSQLQLLTYGFPPEHVFIPHILGLIHVPGLRGNPERTYRTTATRDSFPGTFENYVASIVHYWQATKDDRLRDLGRMLETLGLTWKVEARQIDDTQVELRVGRLLHSARGRAKDMVSIADAGFGVSQILPVLVALLAAEPGQLVYLEQPEMHLHPRAQIGLAQILADAAHRDVRVVVETHSALLLLALQSTVAEGNLAPEKVKLHWFQRLLDGVTEVSSATLDEGGAFGDWPEDFAEVALGAESRYLDAVESYRSQR